MLPSCGNALHKAASFNLHKVVSEHLLCARLFLAIGALYSGCKPELKSLPSSCFLYAYLSKAFFLPPFSSFLKHFAQTSEHLAIISVNPPLSHNSLHFPSDSINSFCCFHHVFPLMDHHSFLLSEPASAFHPLGTTIILSLHSLYLLSHGFVPHSQAPYQLCCAVFLLTCGWK